MHDEPPKSKSMKLVIPELKMVLVEGGTFYMGSEEAEAFEREKPLHKVEVCSFCLGKYLVTQDLWVRVMKENPSRFQGANRPVEQVSWEDIQVFIKKLNKLTGQSYRLLTEAEWEYAARGGQQSQGHKYAGSNKLKDVGWYAENSYGETKPVGQKYPNEIGIHDMSGNVDEWVEDQWHETYGRAPRDGSAWLGSRQNANRVIRGGSWGKDASSCRVSYRGYHDQSGRHSFIGFRLGLSLI